MKTFETLHDAAKAATGARLFTVTVLNRKAGVAWRAYSSHPKDYPVTGTKPLQENDWTRQVLSRAETFVANSTEGFSQFFADHAVINALGCEAVVNIPVSDGKEVQGTVNILDKAGHFTPERVAALEQLVAENRAELLREFRAILEDADR